MHWRKLFIGLVAILGVAALSFVFFNTQYRTAVDSESDTTQTVTRQALPSAIEKMASSAISGATLPKKATNLDGVEDLVAHCQGNRAIAHLPILRSGVQFKKDREFLGPKIETLDTNQFCECIYLILKQSLGTDTLRAIFRDYDHSSKVTPEQLSYEDKQQELAYFSCFGEQIALPGFTPPTSEEITLRINEPNQRGE